MNGSLHSSRTLSGTLTIPGRRNLLEVCVFYILYRLLSSVVPLDVAWRDERYGRDGTEDYERFSQGRWDAAL